MYRQNKLFKIYMFFHIYICMYCYEMEATMELTHIQREKIYLKNDTGEQNKFILEATMNSTYFK